MVRWWLEQGIDGFRLDAISHIEKAPWDFEIKSFKDNDPWEPFMNVAGIEVYMAEFKKIFDEFDALTVGEASGVSSKEAPNWTDDQGYIDMIFELEHSDKDDEGKADLKIFQDTIMRWQEDLLARGWNAPYLENHDQPRVIDVLGDGTEASAKALAVAYMLLRGTPFIYQGQEIGMENQVFESVEDFDDIATINGYHVAKEAGLSEEEALAVIANYSRDNARTPMQWTREPGLGFSDGPAWLISPKPDYSINVEDQEKDPDSILNYYRQLTALYRHPLYGNTIRFGDMIPAYRDRENIIAFERRGDKRLLVISNFQNRQATLELPAPIKTLVLNNTAGLFQEGDQVLELAPYQTVVLELVE